MLKSNILYLVSEFVKKFIKSIPDYSEKENDKLPEVARPIGHAEPKEAIVQTKEEVKEPAAKVAVKKVAPKKTAKK